MAEQHPGERTVARALVECLAELGAVGGYGVIGGGIAPFARALSLGGFPYVHFRHEAGAAFAATAASLAADRPAVVFTTTGPGMMNALTGMAAARSEGARVVLVSGATSVPQRGRAAFQETSPDHFSASASDPSIFHLAQTIHDPAELPALVRKLALGMLRPEGFVAHVMLPLSIQTAVALPAHTGPRPRVAQFGAVPSECVRRLSDEPFAIWVGHGARHASDAVLALAERTGAPVMCSPRAKGVFPEGHPQFIGVTGLGGYGDVGAELRRLEIARTLVLGTRLGESTSSWDPALVPRRGFIHVDLDPKVPGTAYPVVETLAIQAEVRAFLEALLDRLPPARRSPSTRPPLAPTRANIAQVSGKIRVTALMRALQRHVVDGSSAVLLGEVGNAFVWTTHELRFAQPGRHHVGTHHASMGQASAGVVGTALARGKAVAVVGDGALLMNNEISTAAAYTAPAVWVVLNDARYGMIEQGMQSIGWRPFATTFPRVDFVAVARAMGAEGRRLDDEADLDDALEEAMRARGPFVLDVHIDPEEQAPARSRNLGLVQQGVVAAPIGGNA